MISILKSIQHDRNLLRPSNLQLQLLKNSIFRAKVMTSALSTSAAPQRSRRCAIDIGSGVTKFVIAEVHLANEESSASTVDTDKRTKRVTVSSELFSGERSVPFGLAWKQFNKLTPEVCDAGIHFLTQVKKKCEELEVDDIFAIGTEVFRKADGSEDFLKNAKEKTGISLEIASQESEAKFGFRTGKATLDLESQMMELEKAKSRLQNGNGNGHQEVQGGGAELDEQATITHVKFSPADSDRSTSPVSSDNRSKEESSTVKVNECNPGFDMWSEGHRTVRAGQRHLSLPLSSIATGSDLAADLIVYDSGGGSFQILKDPGSSSSSTSSNSDAKNNKKKQYLGTYGIAHATRDFLELLLERRKNGTSTKEWREKVDLRNADPYPITRKEAEAYLERVAKNTFSFPSAQFNQASGDDQEQDSSWLKEEEVLGIGGPDGIFRVAGDLVGKPFFSYTSDELRKAILSEEKFLGKSMDWLTNQYCNFPGAESALYLFPKACSLLVVMEHLKLKRVHWRPCVGSCLGMLLSTK
ncbi:unnamed protein product [Amoebophrya sp. A25]|nr:unnamed protein product [Amoebophrya sp. A25]|eukprot:GSA25T00014647001.1